MKIAHYLTLVHLADGGVVRSVLDLCAVLAGAGHEVTLISYSPRDVPEAWRSAERVPGVPHLRVIERPRLPGDFFTGAQLRRITPMFSDFDVAHFHGPWEPSNMQFSRACRRAGVPYLVSPHGMLDGWSMERHGAQKRLYLALLGRKMLHGAHAVHCTAQAELEQSRRWFPRAPTLVAPLVVDLTPFAELPGPGIADQAFGLEPARARLVFLGRLHPKKGVDILLRAGAILGERGLRPLIVIAGSGESAYRAELESMIVGEDMKRAVKFVGLVSGETKVSLLQGADLLVLPTSQENFGLVLVEAMAAGTPVVTTRGVDIWPELLQSGAARVVERGPEAFAGAIQELLADKEELAAMGRRAREFALDWLEPAKTLARFVDCYVEAARSGKGLGA